MIPRNNEDNGSLQGLSTLRITVPHLNFQMDGKIITRSLNLLYPLELQSFTASTSEAREENIDNVTSPPLTSVEPRKRIHPTITQSISKNTYAILSTTTSSSHHASRRHQHLHATKYSMHVETSNDKPDHLRRPMHVTRDCCYNIHYKGPEDIFLLVAVNVPVGHIRFPMLRLPNTEFFGKECSCTTWTTSCSMYNGRLAKI